MLAELASGNRKERVPFSTVDAHLHQFVNPKYYPTGFSFDDPRNLKKDIIIKFCRHVRGRQDLHGISEGFRFLSYQNGKVRMAADYQTRADKERAARKALKVKSARLSAAVQDRSNRKKDKGKQKARSRVPVLPVGQEDEEDLSDQNERNYPRAGHRSGSILSVGSQQPIPDPDGCAPDPTTTLNSPPIDPALQDNRPTVSPSNQPRPAVGEDDDTHILITGRDMQILKELGYPSVIPVNGPSDGLPIYAVPTAMGEILERQKLIAEQEPAGAPDMLGDADRPPINIPGRDQVTRGKQQPGKRRRGRSMVGDEDRRQLKVPEPEQDTREIKKPSSRKRGGNADMRTIEEGKALLRKQGHARTGRQKRRR